MRPTRDDTLKDIAQVVSQRGTCSRAQVGVVIARDGRVLVTGYNGAPEGMEHCRHDCTCQGFRRPLNLGPGVVVSADGKELHWNVCAAIFPCKISVHGEANAIAYAARYGIRIEGSELVTTLSPCLACAQLIINAGIRRVIAMSDYRDLGGLELLKSAGIALD